jgi:hypothetical protein
LLFYGRFAEKSSDEGWDVIEVSLSSFVGNQFVKFQKESIPAPRQSANTSHNPTPVIDFQRGNKQ